MKPIEISIVIPVFNEERNLRELFKRLVDTLDPLGRRYEIIFTNDGSKDGSLRLLTAFYHLRSDIVTVIDLNGNFGQHTAIIAGFEKARGEIAITLDADLQNPPEEIPKLIAKMDEGHDVVGAFRTDRKDSFGRRMCSRLMNWVRECATGMHMTDQGCMLRAYKRNIYRAVAGSQERALFIPALAFSYASNPTEVEVEHSERLNGKSNYSYYSLIRLNFDLITGFTLLPLQLFTLFGFAISGLSALLVVYMAGRRLIIGPEVEGVFTLFAILFFLVSVAITGIGLVGEYVGRAFQAAQNRPRYLTKEILEIQDREPRVIFFGYSEMGYVALQKLIEKKVNVVGVFTHDDDPDENKWFRSVGQLAEANKLPLYKARSLKSESWTDQIKDLKPDLILSFYYRRLIPQAILDLPTLGAYNMHGSYLPKFRGKAPVNWAVLKGETRTGATLHARVMEPDAGDIVDQEEVLIGSNDSAIEVMKNVQGAAMSILDRQLDPLLSGTAELTPQNHDQATYFGGRKPEDGLIDWNRNAIDIHNLIRAVSRPYPGAFVEIDSARLVVWRSSVIRASKEHGFEPGRIVSTDTLTVSTLKGQLELIDYEWRPVDQNEKIFMIPTLEVGDPLFHPETLKINKSNV
jgi:undecaprenyl-phosphate 4-deoxy-4-formamido-L-arabinose transferase